jgi:hypothetical protein
LFSFFFHWFFACSISSILNKETIQESKKIQKKGKQKEKGVKYQIFTNSSFSILQREKPKHAFFKGIC